MLNRLLLVLALTGAPTAATAQHAAPEIEAPCREAGVTLTVTGYLLPSPSGVLSFPLPLLERLSGEGAILSVDTAPVSSRVVVQVRFGFANVGEFRRWYADERATRLLQEIRATTIGGSFETFVSYRPSGAR